MKKLAVLTLALACAGAAGFAQAGGDPKAGKAKAATCAGCHGQNGISNVPMYPNLRGQKEQYLVSQLKAFRDGDRSNPQMTPMAKPLSDADIANLAAYYSSMSCK